MWLCLVQHATCHLLRPRLFKPFSFGEAALHSSVKGALAYLGLISLAADFGVALKLKLKMDSSANIGICSRKGAGSIRHIATRRLWLQHHVSPGAIDVSKIDGKVNPADRGTKHLQGNQIAPLLAIIGQRTEVGRLAGAPKALI